MSITMLTDRTFQHAGTRKHLQAGVVYADLPDAVAKSLVACGAARLAPERAAVHAPETK